jgi:hypothetical protein
VLDMEKIVTLGNILIDVSILRNGLLNSLMKQSCSLAMRSPVSSCLLSDGISTRSSLNQHS